MKRGVWAVLAVLALTGCSTSSGGPGIVTGRSTSAPASASASASPSPTPPSPQQRYEQAVRADAPLGLWSLTDLRGVQQDDAVEDVSGAARDGRLVEGGLLSTTGPGHEPAARFTGKGRIVTPLVGAMRPGHPFTLEFFFRADDCTRHWTQVAGTASYDNNGRQGVNVLHYPRWFSGGCHLAVEFWGNDHYVGGCGPRAVAHTGTWVHFAVTYDGRTARCYADAKLVGSSPVASFGYVPNAHVGIGGAGSGYAGTLDSGSLADVAVYPAALSAASLRKHVLAMTAK